MAFSGRQVMQVERLGVQEQVEGCDLTLCWLSWRRRKQMDGERVLCGHI